MARAAIFKQPAATRAPARFGPRSPRCLQNACTSASPRVAQVTKATDMKPGEYQQRLRITSAREMLELSQRGIDDIASTVGYNDTAGFRHVFRKIMGLTPSDYRRRFSRFLRKEYLSALHS
ncbi:MAG TPA: helix-turn-helix domain-containing protein [Rhodanobacter sp.]|nr:helix-turn-helix domain-containing protein [Rhodanobacter sp.]